MQPTRAVDDSRGLIEAFLQLLIRKGTRAFAARGAGTLTTFVAHLVLARIMGAAEYGVFIYAYSWVVFLSLTAKWGLDKVMVRFGPPYLAESKFGRFNFLFSYCLRTSLAISLALAGLTLAIVTLLSDQIPPALAKSLTFATVWLPLISAQRVYEGTAETFRNVFQATIPDYIVRPGLLGLFVVLHYVIFNEGPLASQVVNYYSLTLAITVLTHNFWLARVWRFTAPPEAQPKAHKPWLHFGTHMTLINNVSYAVSQADVLIIGALLSTTDAGIYSVAARIATFTAFVATAALMVFSPTVSELHARGALAELRQKSIYLTRRIVLFSLVVSVGLGAIGPWVLGAFGPSFVSAMPPLIVLLIGYSARSFFAVSEGLLNMSGNQLATLRIMTVCACLNILLNVTLLNATGSAVGAAVATAISSVLTYYLLHREAQRRLFKTLSRGGR